LNGLSDNKNVFSLETTMNMNITRTLLLLMPLFLLCFSACNSGTISDPIINVGEENEEMNDAINTARKTFHQFLEKWETMPNDGASVKFGVPTSDDSLEHIWFQPVKITDTEITGICGNDPAKVPGLKLGDERTFKRSEMTDWMILDGAKCYGGYTIRVLVKMEPENAPPLEFVDF